MNLKLIRVTEGDTFTEGKMYDVDKDLFECYTVEDADRHLEDADSVKINALTAIPRGKYNLDITFSNRFQKDLILVEDVSKFTGIRIHTGNSSIDTEGCIIVGSTNKNDEDDWVGGSRIAYKKLHAKVKEALGNSEVVTLEIV